VCMSHSMAALQSPVASQEAFTAQDVGKALKAAGQASEGIVKFSMDEFGIRVKAMGMRENRLSIVIQTDDMSDAMPIIYVEEVSGKKMMLYSKKSFLAHASIPFSPRHRAPHSRIPRVPQGKRFLFFSVKRVTNLVPGLFLSFSSTSPWLFRTRFHGIAAYLHVARTILRKRRSLARRNPPDTTFHTCKTHLVYNELN
jgi:hypothetical protein